MIRLTTLFAYCLFFGLVWLHKSLAIEIYVQDLGADFVPAAGNAQGDLVGYRISTDQAALRTSSGAIIDLGTLGGPQSRATEIADDALVIVGWSDNGLGRENSFRFEGGTMLPTYGTHFEGNLIPDSRAVGIQPSGDIVINILGGGVTVRSWVRADGSVGLTTFPSGTQATGVNNVGTIAYVDESNESYYRLADGTLGWTGINQYVHSAGINDNNLTAGQLSDSLAAFFRIGDANAQFIPNIFTLGADSVVTGISNTDKLYGNTDTTVFMQDLMVSVLYDFNDDFDLVGADIDQFQSILGATDNDVFFGEYTTTGRATRYYRASLDQSLVSDGTSGDFDADGDTDGADFLNWQRDDGTTAGLTAWETSYGSTASLAGSRQVPEPTALAAVLLAAGCSLCCRRFAR